MPALRAGPAYAKGVHRPADPNPSIPKDTHPRAVFGPAIRMPPSSGTCDRRVPDAASAMVTARPSGVVMPVRPRGEPFGFAG